MSVNALYRTSARATGGGDGHAATLDGAGCESTPNLPAENSLNPPLVRSQSDQLVLVQVSKFVVQLNRHLT